MLDSVLVADSGVAAVRAIAALQRLGVRAVGVHTGQDADALHARLADESILIGPTTPAYGDVVKLLEAARQARASGVHPGGQVVPGLQDAALEAGLEWLGERVVLDVAWSGTVAVIGGPTAFAVLPPRAAELVSGVDAVAAALGEPPAAVRGGCAVSVDVVASALSEVTDLELAEVSEVCWDLAVEAGSTPVDPLLAVLTAWAHDEATAWALLDEAATRSVVRGPVVDLPDLVRRARP